MKQNQNNIIHQKDCLDIVSLPIEYDYVISSPPDYEEIGLTPKQHVEYADFLEERLGPLNPKNGFVTIFISDRKFDGGIVTKHQTIYDTFINEGYYLYSQKIWVKSYKKSLYRLNYTFILTFRQRKNKTFTPTQILPDVFYLENPSYSGYRDNFSIDIITPFIDTHTLQNEVVFDPFMGIGTTALACLQTKRSYIGCEIKKTIWDMGNERIRNYQAQQMAPENGSTSNPDSPKKKG